MENIKLLELANEVMENSYSPYSLFPVGAAIEMKDGKIIRGVNVENASFGATICAERSAITAAISLGYKAQDFKKIAITSKMNVITPPCAVCRQVMVEFFNSDVEIIMGNEKLKMQVTNINELVPFRFTESELGDINV
ncbi:MAG: cytidine deaminase [Mycoplasmatales bacterium]